MKHNEIKRTIRINPRDHAANHEKPQSICMIIIPPPSSSFRTLQRRHPSSMNKLRSASIGYDATDNNGAQMYVDDHERRQIVMEKINFMTANKWQLYNIVYNQSLCWPEKEICTKLILFLPRLAMMMMMRWRRRWFYSRENTQVKEAREPVPVANIIHLSYVTHSIEYAVHAALQMLSADHHQLAIDRHPSSSKG